MIAYIATPPTWSNQPHLGLLEVKTVLSTGKGCCGVFGGHSSTQKSWLVPRFRQQSLAPIDEEPARRAVALTQDQRLPLAVAEASVVAALLLAEKAPRDAD